MSSRTRNALKFMVAFAWKHDKAYLILLTLEQVFYFLAGIVATIFPGFILEALFEKMDFIGVLQVVAVYCGLYLVLKSTVQYIRTHIYACSHHLSVQFSVYMGEMTAEIDFKYAEEESTMTLYDRAINCVYEGGFFGTLEKLFSLFGEVLMIASVAAILFSLDVVLVALCLAAIGVNFIVKHSIDKKVHILETDRVKPERQRRYLLSIFDDFAYGKEIRTNNAESFFTEKLIDVSAEIGKINRQINAIFTRFTNLENATSVIEKGGIYALLAYEVIRKGLKVGDFTLYFNAVNRFSDSINALLKGYLSLSKMGLYIGDLEKFMSLPRMDGPRGEEPMESGERFDLELEDVSFRYPGAAGYALRHVNLRIAAGERLAIVGANGAGKTTLVKLLLRLYVPTEGRILLNGRDIRGFRYDEYIREFSAVFQDYKLFAFSLAENVCLSREYNEGEAMEAIRKSGLSGRVSELPLKEKTPLFKAYNEGGVELSGGEGQKLAIARALHKKSRVVVLDEPTAALDPAAEHEIYSRFDELVQGKTSIYITHRLASTRFSEKIIVLDGGRIVEEGDHASLLGRGGLYAQMYNMQAEYYASGEGGNVKGKDFNY